MRDRRATPSVALGLIIGLLTFPSQGAAAEPPRSARLVVPANGNGIPLVIAHMLAKATKQSYDLTLSIDPNDQASLETVIERFASAPSDGKTLLVLSRGMQTMLSAQGQDAVGRLKPVAGVAEIPYLIVTPFGAPAKTVPEFILLSQKRKDAITYGTAAVDHLARMVGEMLNKSNGSSIRHVAFDGTFTALGAVMRGKVSVAVEIAPATLPYVRTRRLLGIATTSKKRLATAPTIPALAEVAPDVDLVCWTGLFAPADTPQSIIEGLNRKLDHVVRSLEVHVRLTHMGLIPIRATPARFAAMVNADPYAPISDARVASRARQ